MWTAEGSPLKEFMRASSPGKKFKIDVLGMGFLAFRGQVSVLLLCGEHKRQDVHVEHTIY